MYVVKKEEKEIEEDSAGNRDYSLWKGFEKKKFKKIKI